MLGLPIMTAGSTQMCSAIFMGSRYRIVSKISRTEAVRRGWYEHKGPRIWDDKEGQAPAHGWWWEAQLAKRVLSDPLSVGRVRSRRSRQGRRLPAACTEPVERFTRQEPEFALRRGKPAGSEEESKPVGSEEESKPAGSEAPPEDVRPGSLPVYPAGA
jgi:hypothetical protein